ncbi:hypothetical protein SEVIR_1G102502v4 [Setaria viridis]
MHCLYGIRFRLIVNLLHAITTIESSVHNFCLGDATR